jgi:hypothetical protein
MAAQSMQNAKKTMVPGISAMVFVFSTIALRFEAMVPMQ